MYPDRIRNTYAEHAQILRGILRRKSDQTTLLLKAHIEESKAEVRKISLHKLFEAKSAGTAWGFARRPLRRKSGLRRIPLRVSHHRLR